MSKSQPPNQEVFYCQKKQKEGDIYERKKLSPKYEVPRWLLDILYWTGIVSRPRQEKFQPKTAEPKVIQVLRASGFKFGKSEDGHLLKPEERNLI